MKLYHTSNIAISSPDIIFSRDALDFGKGFYLTTILEQAINYGSRFTRRGQQAWLNTFQFDADFADWKTKIFNEYNQEWLEFVANCRAGNDNSDFDIVIGGIANDKVILTIERYFAGEINVNDALGLLKYIKPNIQYCIRNQHMIEKCLTHIESKLI